MFPSFHSKEKKLGGRARPGVIIRQPKTSFLGVVFDDGITVFYLELRESELTPHLIHDLA